MKTKFFKIAFGTLSVILLCFFNSCVIDFGDDDEQGQIQGIVTNSNIPMG